MIPEAQTQSQVTSTVTINCLVVFVQQAAAPPPTCRGQHVQSLQAVFARWRVVSGLGEAALALVQHGSWRDDTRGRDFTHHQVQVLNLSLLTGLQVVHLRQVSAVRKERVKNNSCEVSCSQISL